MARAGILRQFEQSGEKHLVFVRYKFNHDTGDEWVYNDADIDHAKTVWAREIPGMDLSPLLRYFQNRDVWVFEPDEDDESVQPYSPKSPGSQAHAP